MARRTAELLDVPWQFIRSNVRTLKKLYNSEERKRYADYADGLVTVPAYVEYEAFSKIAEENIIPKDSLIVNGQSGDYLFGGHVPASLYSTDKLEDVVDYIVRKHCMHWPELLEYDHESRLYRSIETQLQNQIVEQGQHGQDLLLALYEFWEWSERQPKATVNNQRLYEFFGYQWALPLWDAEMMDFWAKVPYEEKLNQKLHQDYLRSYNYQGVFDRGRAPQKAFVGHHSWVIWLARVLGSVGGSVWKDRFYEHMFFYTYFRAQLGLFGRPFYIQNYKKTRRPRVVAFGARFRLHELGILGMDEANLPLIEP
jgi:asparagine synthase (glutamine-hydrolysing)